MTSLFLAEGERERILIEWNDTGHPCPADRTITDLIADQVRRRPDAVAVVAEDATLSYAELDARARKVAAALIRLGARPELRVVLFLSRTSAIPVAVLSVLQAGAAYVPLDAERSGHRLQTALADPGVFAVLTESALRADLPVDSGTPVLCVDDIDADPITDVRPVPTPDALACLVYTSGSTGRPKGVSITHGNLAGLYYAWEKAYELPDLRVHGQLTSFSFVVFQADLVRALCSGATLVLFSSETVLAPGQLYEEMVRHRVEFVEFVPALLRALLRHCADNGGELDFLRLLVVGSDRWLYGEHESLRESIGGTTRVVHSFGLTETTVDSSYFTGTELGVSNGRLTPIGRPFPNVRTYVLDGDLEPAPIGTSGELYIGGVGVTRGYLGEPALTAERFGPDPFGPPGSRLYRTGDLARHLGDGNLQFLGRQDSMVKIRGFRVELGEVEFALRRHPGVRDAAVVAVDTGADTAIAAYVVPARPRLDAGEHNLVALPNGMSVASINHAETHQFYQELFVDRMYLRHGVAVRDGDVVFDVGANIGMFALCVHAEAEVSVYAFEPSPEVFEALSLNAAMFGLNARLFLCGLSDRARREPFTFYPASTGMSSVYGDVGEERSVLGAIIGNQFGGSADIDEWLDERLRSVARDCELRTLSSVLDGTGVDRIDLLKIVVQKGEQDVLNGVREEHWPLIGQLVIEAYDIAGRVESIREELTRRGYSIVVDQAPLFVGSNVHLVYAVRPDWRDRETVAATADLRTEAVASLSVRGLYDYLRDHLADYMVPSRLALVERLPLTTTGKIDRNALPADDLVDVVAQSQFVAPRTHTEAGLAEIWTEVLKAPRVGVLDDFFRLGGHSLLATQVVSRIRDRWGIEIPLRTYLRDRTIAELATRVDQLRAAPTGGPAEPAIRRLDRSAYRVARPESEGDR